MTETQGSLSRKRKPKIETENSDVPKEKKEKKFCCQTFRKELRGSEVLKSLNRFILACKDSVDVIYEYLEQGGSLQEILSVIDLTAAGDLTTAVPVFKAVHLILLRCQSVDSKYRERCIEGARNILRFHMVTIKALLSMNTPKHKKVGLKVLTTIATLDSSFANEIINVMALSPMLINDFIQPSSEKESVRKCFIMFLLSFLIEGNYIVVRTLLDKKGLLSSIIPGLKFDEVTTVNMALSLLEEKILKNVKIQKTLKLKLFNTQIIKSLFDLFDWKGLQGAKQISCREKNKRKEVEIDQNEKEIVAESVHSFLLLLLCSQKYGVAFHDKSFGTSDHFNNQLLLTVFESISDPLRTKKIADVLLKTITCCPDLMKPVLLKLEPAFEPRNSKNWFQAMDFAENLVKAVDAANMLKVEAESLTPSEVVKAGKILCAPVTFLKVSKSACQKSETIEIRFRCLCLMTIMWRETQKLIGAFQGFRSELQKNLHKHFMKSVPDAEALIELWHTVCDPEFFISLPLSQEKKILFLSVVLESFHIVLECQKDAVCSPLGLASDLLCHVDRIKGNITDGHFENIQVQIVKLTEKDLQFLTPNSELFYRSLKILLQSTETASLSFLSKIIASLEIFGGNKAEVDVWLSSYMSVKEKQRAPVADFIIKSLELVKRNCSSSGNQILTRVAGSDFLSVSPMILNCLTLVKTNLSLRTDSNEKVLNFCHYLNDVVIHLQFFYGVDIYLYDHVKQFNEILTAPILDFLRTWKRNSFTLPGSDVLCCSEEQTLVLWIGNSDSVRQCLKEIVESSKTNLLKLYSLFTIAVSCFIKKSVNEELSECDVQMFSEVLSLFLCHAPEDDRRDVDCISFDLTNGAVYQRACLNRLFRNTDLLKRFDIFERNRKKSVFNTTAIILKVLMEKEILRSTTKTMLAEPWKIKFLGRLKSKLKKNKIIECSDELEKVLEFFEFNYNDVSEVIEIINDVSDMNLFVSGNRCSGWILILSKFLKLYCKKEELKESVIKKLCLIVIHLSNNCLSTNMTDCLLDLLREHPRHLLLIDNEFLSFILLETTFTPAHSTLGKLLLNDPKKVRYFLETVSKNLDHVKDLRLAFSLLSNLITNDKSLRVITSSQKERSIWAVNEIGPETTKQLYYTLEAIYKNYEDSILHALLKQKGKAFLENLDFTRHLIMLFLDKKTATRIKKEIPKGLFQPKLLYEAAIKINDSSVTESYLLGLLKMFCKLIKNEEQDVVWEEKCDIVSDVLQLNKNFAWGSVIESAEWKEFAKLAIGHCFGVLKDSSLLKIFRLLVTTFYKANEECKDCGTFFQMVIAHSQFLKVMFGSSPLKSESVELFYCLVKRSPSQMSPKHVPMLLASYNAGLSSQDTTLLEVLRLYEKSGVSVTAYEPFVWGDTAVSHYSIGTNPGLSLWQRFSMKNILDLLDRHRLELSLKEFPIRRGLESRQNENSVYDANVYDPAFLLPLFVSLMSPGAVVYSLAFIYKGGLAYTVRALSSECKDVRLMASLVLMRFYNHLELSQNLKQKFVWMHFVNRLRYGIEDLADSSLPNVMTLFLARMTLELSRQPAEMFSPLQNYLLAKSSFAFDVVPEFLPLFHSSEVAYRKHREWLLEILRDGTKTSSDVGLIFHTMAPKVLFCFFSSQLCDVETKKLIVEVLERMLRVVKAVILISEYGLLSWIYSLDPASCQPILFDLLKLISTLTTVIVKDIKYHKNKHFDLSHLIQILNAAMKLFSDVKCLKSFDAVSLFLKVVKECLILFFEEKQGDWLKLNKNKVFDVVSTASLLLDRSYDFQKLSKLPFYFRSFDENRSCEITQNLRDCAYFFGALENNK